MGISSAGFLEPAVYPPEICLTLVTHHLPWEIVVPASNGQFVTVSDILNSVHRALHSWSLVCSAHKSSCTRHRWRTDDAVSASAGIADTWRSGKGSSAWIF
jgi:hypothetical protein